MTGWDDSVSPANDAAPAAISGDGWETSPAPLTAGGPADVDSNGSAAVTLTEDPDAAALLAALRALPEGSTPRIDGSAVARLSMPALQVLLAAMREAGEAGARLAIRDPSFALSLAFEAFGFCGPDEPFTVEYS
jgi:hypothetical protein